MKNKQSIDRKTALPGNGNGFTMVELLIAISILAMILITIYAAFQGTIKVIRTGSRGADNYQHLRLAIESIRRDLVCAFIPPGEEGVLKGIDNDSGGSDMDSIDFVTASNLMADPGEDRRESDICEVGYFISDEHEGVLVRRVDLTVDSNPFSGGRLEPIAEKVVALNFQYYDAEEDKWLDSWDPEAEEENEQIKGLPPIVWVEVTVVDAEGKEHTSSTSVILELGFRDIKDDAKKEKRQRE